MQENNFDNISQLPWMATADWDNERFNIVREEKGSIVETIASTDYDSGKEEANIDYIVHCCNSYPSLIEENKRLREALKKSLPFLYSHSKKQPPILNEAINNCIENIRQLIELNNKL